MQVFLIMYEYEDTEDESNKLAVVLLIIKQLEFCIKLFLSL